MNILNDKINELLQQLPAPVAARLRAAAGMHKDMYPFNGTEYLINGLIEAGVLSPADYQTMRTEYCTRNRYIDLFSYAPRSFGDTWGQPHLLANVPGMQQACMALDANFRGEYDLLFNGIKVEVKASRVAKKHPGGTLASKALVKSLWLQNREPFDMNFQQLKPDCCDVFVWMAVWSDCIDYWVIPAQDIKKHRSFSNQHRGSQTAANGAVVEGQFHINHSNYDSMNPYKVDVANIGEKITLLRATGKI
ncbi:MAG: hypothetical protein K2L33_05070 [Muribaculaceae bacterium]|nr:hypothetical protein [Muribaculaceae bacterium]